MSKEQDTSAFPLHMHGDYGKGMTLRDYFAAAALQGILSNPECNWTLEGVLAVHTYKLADAMLAARKEGA